MKPMLLAVLILAAAATLPAAAQQGASHPAAAHGEQPMAPNGANAGTADQAFQAASEKMMHDMAVPMSGDPDRDFVTGMLPHHQGTVDMAKVELQYGKDPELRQLAASIVQAQEQEIALMKAWQVRHAPQ